MKNVQLFIYKKKTQQNLWELKQDELESYLHISKFKLEEDNKINKIGDLKLDYNSPSISKNY